MKEYQNSAEFNKKYLALLTKKTILLEVSSSFTLIFSNRAYLKIKNLEFEDIRYENIFDVAFQYVDKETYRKLKNAFEHKIKYSGIIQDKDSDGNTLFFKIDLTPMFENDKFKMFVLTFEDKTAQMNIEENEKKRNLFIAKVSHDLKSPINNINSYLSLLETTELDEEQKEYFETIKNQSGLLLDLVRDIIDYSKIASGEIKLNLISINLKEELLPFLNSFNSIMKEKKINYKINISEFEYKVLVDKLRLIQILNNFISNASKFTGKEGNITVNILKENETEEEYQIKFSVKDNGIGMTEKQKSLIFNEFQQADETIVKKYGGTGLGLSISLFFVKLMGGNIYVDSTENLGSEFYFTLNVKKGKKIEKVNNKYAKITIKEKKNETKNN